jgi:streptogramin lyase
VVLRIGLRSLVLGALIAAFFAAPALAVPTVAGEFKVSGLDTNNKIAAGPDGNMWVIVSSATEDVAKITPSGEVTEYDLKTEEPAGIVSGPGGLIWVSHKDGVTSFSPADPEGTKVNTEVGAIEGESSIVLAPDGNLWVATKDSLIRVPPSNPSGFKAFPIVGLAPKDIDVAGSLLAIADAGGNTLVTATTTDPPVLTGYNVGGPGQGVAGGPNGQIAFTQPVNEPKQIGLLTPPALAPKMTNIIGQDAFGITLGADGAYWSAERNGDQLIRITTEGRLSSLTGFAKGSSPRQIAAGPGNTLWVTLDETDKVAKVTGVDPPAPPAPPPVVVPPKAGRTEPRTTLTKGPKGVLRTTRNKLKVIFSFESPDAGATFECRVVAILRKKKAKASVVPEFKPCASPKSSKLKAGRYRFEVRAVLAGVPDPTPEKRSFRIVRAAKS